MSLCSTQAGQWTRYPLRIYIVEAVMDNTIGVREGLKKFFPASSPTSTWIGVPRLANKDFLYRDRSIGGSEVTNEMRHEHGESLVKNGAKSAIITAYCEQRFNLCSPNP
ncbi:MAG: hypothetical protein U0694_26305 [Anaerolineae bacterium]